MRSTEKYFAVLLYVMSFNVVPTFESVEEILKCDHLNESYRKVLFCGAESRLQGFVLISQFQFDQESPQLVLCAKYTDSYIK